MSQTFPRHRATSMSIRSSYHATRIKWWPKRIPPSQTSPRNRTHRRPMSLPILSHLRSESWWMRDLTMAHSPTLQKKTVESQSRFGPARKSVQSKAMYLSMSASTMQLSRVWACLMRHTPLQSPHRHTMDAHSLFSSTSTWLPTMLTNCSGRVCSLEWYSSLSSICTL